MIGRRESLFCFWQRVGYQGRPGLGEPEKEISGWIGAILNLMGNRMLRVTVPASEDASVVCKSSPDSATGFFGEPHQHLSAAMLAGLVLAE